VNLLTKMKLISRDACGGVGGAHRKRGRNYLNYWAGGITNMTVTINNRNGPCGVCKNQIPPLLPKCSAQNSDRTISQIIDHTIV